MAKKDAGPGPEEPMPDLLEGESEEELEGSEEESRSSETSAEVKPKRMKGATRKAIEEAATIEELSAIVAGLHPGELAEAQAPIYQARRRIVAAGIPKV